MITGGVAVQLFYTRSDLFREIWDNSKGGVTSTLKGRGCSSKILKRTAKEYQDPVFWEWLDISISFLRGINSKSIHSLLSYFSAQHSKKYRKLAPAEDPLKTMTPRDTITAFLLLKRSIPVPFIWESHPPPPRSFCSVLKFIKLPLKLEALMMKKRFLTKDEQHWQFRGYSLAGEKV